MGRLFYGKPLSYDRKSYSGKKRVSLIVIWKRRRLLWEYRKVIHSEGGHECGPFIDEEVIRMRRAGYEALLATLGGSDS